MNAKATTRIRLSSHPAESKAFGIVNAPVPTIRLNMKISPTCVKKRHVKKIERIDQL